MKKSIFVLFLTSIVSLFGCKKNTETIPSSTSQSSGTPTNNFKNCGIRVHNIIENLRIKVYYNAENIPIMIEQESSLTSIPSATFVLRYDSSGKIALMNQYAGFDTTKKVVEYTTFKTNAAGYPTVSKKYVINNDNVTYRLLNSDSTVYNAANKRIYNSNLFGSSTSYNYDTQGNLIQVKSKSSPSETETISMSGAKYDANPNPLVNSAPVLKWFFRDYTNYYSNNNPLEITVGNNTGKILYEYYYDTNMFPGTILSKLSGNVPITLQTIALDYQCR